MSFDHYSHLAWDVALIDPDGFSAALKRRRSGRRLFPHLGLGYLAACLERNGERVSVLDAGVSNTREIRHFLSQPYQAVGITANSFTFREAQAAARELKRRYPHTPVVLGGPHVSIDPEGCVSGPEIDFAFRGEGEIAMIDLLEVLKRSGSGKPDVFSQVPGLVYKAEGRVGVNPPADRIRDLDQLPYPAWHLFPMRRYRQHAFLSSRGCPMDCAFCAIKTIWGAQWIRRDPEQVVNEIAWLLKQWGPKLIHVNDDNLTMNPAHITKFCDEIIKRRMQIQWVVQGMRADAAHPDIAAKMRRAGCQRVSLGIESNDPGVLEAIGKQETPADMMQAIRVCRQAGIQVLGMFMIGNPGDTLQTVSASMRFARENDIDLPAFYMALPYPKTRLWEYIERHGRFLNRDYLSYNHMSPEPVFETPEFSAEERKKIHRKAENFCRRQALKYHIMFWWPPRLLKRNGHEIRRELITWLKVIVMPLRVLRFWRRHWNAGGFK
ncbi:radical SAM protein [candidate division FCPU426 bacterium]|nr:radical SAM protein [candidate division FCPU426 bacterium]